MKALGIVAAVVLALLFAWPARAQEVNLARIEESQNRVFLKTGAEYGLVAGLGYSRAVPFLGRTILVGGDLTAPIAGLGSMDYRLRASLLAPIVGAQGWKLAGTFAPTLRATDNDAGRLINLGVDVGALGGWYALGWFAAGELGFDWAITTHVTHSDRYRQLVFDGARDGWYASPGGNVRAGVQAGVSLARSDLVVRVGVLRDAGGNKPMLPAYVTLALDTRF
jgi:hypothetical protein